MNFFVETLVGGLLAGVMYSLVAIGFVLIYKASGVFNFAQGSMVLCAALTFVTLRDNNVDFWLAAVITLAIMVAIAIAVERVVLRPLVNQPQITLFMATLGLSFVIEGLSQIAMGASVHELDLGIVDTPIMIGEIQVSQFDLAAAATAGILVVALSIFFNKTRVGVSLRAIADDPQAALSIGVRLQTLWQIVWAWPASSRSWPACSGDRARACSSRSPSSCSRRCRYLSSEGLRRSRAQSSAD
jgi:branched-chain amino acid transport system permease protein